MEDEKTSLAILRTRLANKRTTMSFLRTGLAILSIAIIYKKVLFIILGLIIIICSNIEYYFINSFLSDNEKNFNQLQIFDFLPIIYSILFIIALYYEFIYMNKIEKGG
jgi:uncharacterized membrane protein YidH (DUF202 family)